MDTGRDGNDGSGSGGRGRVRRGRRRRGGRGAANTDVAMPPRFQRRSPNQMSVDSANATASPSQNMKHKTDGREVSPVSTKRVCTEPSASSAASCSTVHDLKHLTDTEFKSLQWISKNTRRAIDEVLGFTRLTQVQDATLSEAVAGHDILAKARTGTGKTLGFLLPSVERLLKLPALMNDSHRRQISVLVLSPTRELASQIAKEAASLLSFQPLGVACVVGGTNLGNDHRRLAAKSPTDILVATPGRLADHLTNTPGVVQRLQSLKVLVLDEADQLLEQGFRPEIERIVARLPKERQTLLFSATMPPALLAIKQLMLLPQHKFINCIDDADDQTNAQVTQQFVVCDLDQHVRMCLRLLQAHVDAQRRQNLPFKVIVFFATARVAGFMAQLFGRLGFPVLEMHSRKSQSFRTKTAAQFRANENLMMFSSDVSARGVDYPDVTFILQVGLTIREQYIHRLGRTARAGRAGHGVLLLCRFEESLLKDLSDLPITELPEEKVPNDAAAVAKLDEQLRSISSDSGLREAAEMAYQAFLGYYNGNLKRLRWDKETLVQTANMYAAVLGLLEPPTLQRRTVGKMGLKGTRGLRVE